MNNAGALYVEAADRWSVVEVLTTFMTARGFASSNKAPSEISGRIMIPEKRRRHFFIVSPQNDWITIWEDPRYFADRDLARVLARELSTRSVWIEVSGNGVGWARGVYMGEQTVEEQFEATETMFYGEYGTIYFAYDVDRTPDELIGELGLPYDELHYEAVIEGELPVEVGEPLYLVFERS
jgi:hypothetical protein